MANHPDPNQPEQPDDPNKNPPSSETNIGGTAADHHASQPTSDSFVDLGMPGGPADPFASPPPGEVDDLSDQSIVEWAALVEEAPKGDANAEPRRVRIDVLTDDTMSSANLFPHRLGGKPR